MMDWISRHLEFVSGAVAGIVSAAVTCWLFLSGKVSTLNNLVKQMEDVKEKQSENAKHIRELQDAQIETSGELKRLEKIEATSSTNSTMLAKICGKLGIEG